jgi:hypothetical protein
MRKMLARTLEPIIHLNKKSSSSVEKALDSPLIMMAKRPVHLTENQMSEVDAEKPEAGSFQCKLPELLTNCAIIIRVEEQRCDIEDTIARMDSIPIDHPCDLVVMHENVSVLEVTVYHIILPMRRISMSGN